MNISIIVATDKNLGIGKSGNLPWDLKTEMKYFSETTQATNNSYVNIVIMGRNTWESIPPQFRPLRNRINIILTSRPINLTGLSNTGAVSNLKQAMNISKSIAGQKMIGSIFVIGGLKLYQEVLLNPQTEDYKLDFIYQTEIYDDFN